MLPVGVALQWIIIIFLSSFFSFFEWLHLPPADRLMMIPSIIQSVAALWILKRRARAGSWKRPKQLPRFGAVYAAGVLYNNINPVVS